VLICKGKIFFMCFEIRVAVKTFIMAFRIMTPCSFVGGDQCFGGTYQLHLQETTYKTTWHHNPEDYNQQ
jgi:hypothetical protein